MPSDPLRRDALPFDPVSDESVSAAADAVIADLGPGVEVLGFGEALHGGEEILRLRNRLIRRLAGRHGFSAVVLESDLVRGRLVDDFVAGRGPASFGDVAETGFGHGFGRMEANRELAEWMRGWNDESPAVPLRFYGFDIPAGAAGYAAPRGSLRVATDRLAAVDEPAARSHWGRIEPLLGEDAAWESVTVFTDPTKGVGGTPQAAALRAAVEDLIADLHRRRPGRGEGAARAAHLEAMQFAVAARWLLASHAAQARGAANAELLGIRGGLMADALETIAELERGRGRVFVFAHNGHLQRGRLSMPGLGAWWPAGSHLAGRLGPRHAAIGTGVVESAANGIAPAEAGTLEGRLAETPGPARLVSTRGLEVPTPARSRSARNPSYLPLSSQSLTDFDWLAVLDEVTYTRGGRQLGP